MSLNYHSATQLIDAYRSKEISPVEVMTAIIARAEAVEPRINALPYTFFDHALGAARAAEAAYQNGTARPLEGIALAVKDETPVEGQITSNGSVFWKDNVMPFTDPMVQNLLEAGAIIHARSAAPEFSVHQATWSKLHGVTDNPWSKGFSTGGSSGGSAAALAAGTTTLATGSDIAGSIRMPASNCGIVGFKAPYARVPQAVGFNLETYASQGAMTRTVADSILMQNVISGPHPADPTAVSPKITLPDAYPEIRGMRIGYSLDLGYIEIDPDVRRNTLAMVEKLRDLGAIVEEVDIGWTRETERHYENHLCGFCVGGIRDIVPEDRHGELTSYVRYFLDRSEGLTLDDYMASHLHRLSLMETMIDVFQSCEALICPTMSTVRVPSDYDFEGQDHLEVNGKPTHAMWGAMLTYPFNMINQLPILNVPTGRGDNGVPTGLQIIGAGYRDEVVYRVGYALEQADGPFLNLQNMPAL